jgi:hypothetical protein
VVNCAGDTAGAFGPLDQLGDEAFPVVQRWMMGPVNLVRTGIKHVRDGLH